MQEAIWVQIFWIACVATAIVASVLATWSRRARYIGRLAVGVLMLFGGAVFLSHLQTGHASWLLTLSKACELPARRRLSDVLPGTGHGRRRHLLRNRATLRQCSGLFFGFDTVGPGDDVDDRRDEDQAQQADDE